ncbi:MAG TPA: DUF4142 domain-containing protein [Cyclobacteriaceae bacterium]|jgi:putative membrane protein|nr:DUF4142 domain-containing protein [Cyclobacteriaceae bacterium]
MRKIKNIGMLRVNAVLVFTLITGASSFSFAQNSLEASSTPGKQEIYITNSYTARDAEFLSRASEINMEEISLGQLAQKRSTMADVKDLGKMMEEVHTKSMKDLTALAKAKMITIPKVETYKAQKVYGNLNSKTDADFDKAYCDAMIMGHKHAITLFEKASQESDDADIKKWATETLPVLRTHLEHSISCLEKCEKVKG